VDSAFADSELAEFVERLNSEAGGEFDVVAMRAGGAVRSQTRPAGPSLDRVHELEFGGRPARLYRPSPEGLPLIVYVHGGGWTIGSLDTHDRLCRLLAAGTGAAVVALDYRLAPEHPWPAGVDDVVSALRELDRPPRALGLLSGAVVLAGDSAGGTLATLACLRLRDEHPASLPALQVLLCANTDLTGSSASMREKGHGWGLEADAIRFFNTQWVPDSARWSDPAVSPLYADLSGVPPALVITAENDPLRDEGEAYAERLTTAGVPVRARREPGLIHAFVMLDAVSPACAAALDRVIGDLRDLLGVSPVPC
jgi:acetyl esterase